MSVVEDRKDVRQEHPTVGKSTLHGNEQTTTIPLNIREAIGLEEGDEVVWDQAKDGEIYIDKRRDGNVLHHATSNVQNKSGTVTVPTKIREYLGIEVGDTLYYIESDGLVLFYKEDEEE